MQLRSWPRPKAGDSLFQFPNRGRVVPEYGDDTIRELFVDRYRLIYRVRSNSVLIAAFVHGSRDLSALLPPIEQ